MKDYNIVVVDDKMNETAAFIQKIKKGFSDANISLYNKVEDAIEYIINTLETRTIVFLDCSFDEGEQGIDGLKAIREKTDLLSVVMMSGKNLQSMGEDELMSMINADNLYFIKNTNMQAALELITKIQGRWRSQIDCLLEQWVLRHEGDSRDKPYMSTPKGSMSLNDVLREIRNKTDFGITMERSILQVAVDALTREPQK